MTKAKRVLLDGYCYHLITRGNQKQNIFLCEEDYLIYLKFLKKFKQKYGFMLYTYCLMPNHIHLLGEMPQLHNLSCFMHDLNRTYTLYFNNKYNKVGHLWQGRFISKLIYKDRYFIDCINYIELNPLRAGITKTAYEYPWSSYSWRVLEEENKLIDGLPNI